MTDSLAVSETEASSVDGAWATLWARSLRVSFRRGATVSLLVFLVGCASSSSSSGSRSSMRSTTPTSAPAPSLGSASRSAPKIERGQASFYGGKYHGRKTASGEIFDKNALTAAHQWLAFGTRVRVTSLENKKNVVVRINDRFPGTKGRLIDLSEGAFLRLSPLAKGVIPVQLEVVR